MNSPFLDRLERGPILADGAIGTLLYAQGVSPKACFEELNISQPEVVAEVHRRYLQAGAEIIGTNTFAANRIRLAEHGLQAQVREINLQAARIARDARDLMGATAFVAGVLGPIGIAIFEDAGSRAPVTREAYQEQIEALVDGGVDLIALETFDSLAEVEEVVLNIKSTCDLPIMAQLAFNAEGRTAAGETPEEVVRLLESLGVNVVGANCGAGPQTVEQVVQRMAAVARVKVSAQPNVGQPSRAQGRYLYDSTPAQFAGLARRLLEAGAWVIGGCCGTTPEHIAAMRAVLPAPARAEPASSSLIVPVATVEASSEGQPLTLREKLAAGRLVVSVELDPPRGIGTDKMLEAVAMLQEAGVDVLNVADSPMARVRMSCLATAYLIQGKLGLETVVHYTTRDRNLMALQSDLLGAAALGIRNILALKGDPPRLGSHITATGVWDVNSIGLVRIIKGLNAGIDSVGASIGRPTDFFVGVALTPGVEDRRGELKRLRAKLKAGADFIMTQPIYDIQALFDFLDEAGPIDVPVLLGIMPLHGYRHAEFMRNEVPGISIPDHVMERMRKAGRGGVAEGLQIAREMVEQACRRVSGLYIMPSFGHYEPAAELVRELKAGAKRSLSPSS